MADPDKEGQASCPLACSAGTVGDSCSRSFGDEERCLLGTVLRAVLL